MRAMLLCLALVGCGGGGEAPTVIASHTCGAVSIALYGDSTNDGVDGATHERANPDPQHALQALVEARLGPNRVGVSNRAVSGTSSGDLAAVSSEFDIAVINFGINDARLGMPLDTYRANLRRLYRPGVVFKTANPVWGEPFDVQPYAQAMRGVAQELHAPLIETNGYILGLQDWQALEPDHMHPTGILYEKIAEDSAGTLLPLVSGMCR